MIKNNTKDLVKIYLEKFASEVDEKHILNKQIKKQEIIDNRLNFGGHITASAFILNSTRDKILLIKHKKLNLLLQPGGHVDKDENVFDCCKREIAEELGILKLRYLPIDINYLDLPIDIDTHYIPENLKKNEAEHYHHDFRFLFICDEAPFIYSEEELNGYEWVNVNKLTNISGAERVRAKIKSLALDKSFEYFNKVISSYGKRDVDIICVTHLVKNIPSFIYAIDEIANLKFIIPKPNSIQNNIKNLLSTNYSILPITKEDISVQNYEQIKKMIDINKSTIIIDIGGYFSSIATKLKLDYPELLLGIIEDTENGLQKYQKQTDLSLPVISVARSVLKENEDFLVGHSIAFSVNNLLRQQLKIFNYSKIGIIGYGKIGRGIADYVLKHNNQPSVFDIDPIRMVSAYNQECKIINRESLIAESEIIFCATGSKSLNLQEFLRLRNGCFVASVTSKDDEFELIGLNTCYQVERINQNIYKYFNNEQFFYLLNNGNAVNFIDGGVLDSFIYLVQGEILEACKILLDGRFNPAGIQEISLNTKKELAEKWLTVFSGLKEQQ